MALKETAECFELTHADFGPSELAVDMLCLLEAQSAVRAASRAVTQRIEGAKKNAEIADRLNINKEAETLIGKYEEQQKNVRNNREFDSLAKETEYQELEIQLSEKRIKEFQAKIEQKNEVISTTKEKLDKQQVHLDHKKAELNSILKETEKEETLLLDKSKEFSASIDNHLLTAYTRIRNKVKNGLAVVSIERGASGGSFFTIPPQIQLEIANRKKITIDEHSGRILIDADLAAEEKEKIDSLFA